jgi:phosphorylcholine metabolism protein LicD
VNEQLIWIANLFNKYQINYWVDSGTLLGIMRDGNLIEGDKDIDISIWVKEEKKLKKILPLLENKGYLISISSYNSCNFKYKFIPMKDNKKLLIIDVSLFDTYLQYAWCPQVVNFRAYYKLPVKLRKYISYAYLKYKKSKRNDKNIKIQKISYPHFFRNLETWWIPLSYFKKITCLDKLKIHIPEDWENYLEFRYGNWGIPNKDWVFINDDKGLIHKNPSELVLKK